MKHLLLNILIILFVVLFLYNVFLANKKVIENMESDDSAKDDSEGDYKDYNKDPMILAQQNAGNIQVLRKQIDKAMEMINKIDPKQEDMQKQVDSNTNSIQTIIQGQQDNANQKAGMDSDPTPADITGLD
jgi:TolA-binding protein